MQAIWLSFFLKGQLREDLKVQNMKEEITLISEWKKKYLPQSSDRMSALLSNEYYYFQELLEDAGIDNKKLSIIDELMENFDSEYKTRFT